MNPYLVVAGIRFNDYVFSEPRPLAEWTPPKCAGICAILARDPNWAPKAFQALCFWEFGNNSDLLRLARMPHTETLFVSELPMPFSTSVERAEPFRATCRAQALSHHRVYAATAAHGLEKKA